MASSLPKEFLAEMNDDNQNRIAAKSLFKIHDSDKDGLIELNEFKAIAKHLNIALGEEELIEDFEAIDEGNLLAFLFYFFLYFSKILKSNIKTKTKKLTSKVRFFIFFCVKIFI